MSTANELVQRLRNIGFVNYHTGRDGIVGRYVSEDSRMPRLDGLPPSIHLELSADHTRRAALHGRGSIYIHEVPDSAPVELRKMAVIFATGPYEGFFADLVPASGHSGLEGGNKGWCGHAADVLVKELEVELGGSSAGKPV